MTAPFAEMLRTERERRGFSQRLLARASGTTASYISRLESGSREPSRPMIMRIARTLALSEFQRDALLHRAGFTPLNLERYLEVSTPEITALARVLLDERLSESERHQVLSKVRELTATVRRFLEAA